MAKDDFYKLSEIGLVSYNIHGLTYNINNFRYSKLGNPYVQNLFNKYKIIGLIETHHESKDIGSIHVENFVFHSKCRAKSNKKSNKPSGGLNSIVCSKERTFPFSRQIYKEK